jgi:SAM-dependent methyltransferase
MTRASFADVDASGAAARLGAYLDGMAQLPAIRAGKRRRDGMLAFAGARVLDVGCGTGEDVRAMSRLVGPRGRAVGADASEDLLELARARVRPGDGPLIFLRADAAALPFADRSFDGVRIERALQHVPDPDAALREAVRVLRPGGRLVAVEPDWSTAALDLEPPELARLAATAVAASVRHATVGRTLRRRLLDAGLEAVEVRADALVITDPAALGAADPSLRMAEALGARGPSLLAAIDAAAAGGRFLAALTLFEASGRR